MSVRISFCRRISAVNMQTAFPPRDLACSIAWSAWFISSDTLDCAGLTERDPEADRPADLLAADLHRLVRGPSQQLGIGRGAVLGGRAVHHRDELVAAEPGQQVALRARPVSVGAPGSAGTGHRRRGRGSC